MISWWLVQCNVIELLNVYIAAIFLGLVVPYTGSYVLYITSSRTSDSCYVIQVSAILMMLYTWSYGLGFWNCKGTRFICTLDDSFTNMHLNFDKQSLNKPNDKKIIPPLDLFNIGLKRSKIFRYLAYWTTDCKKKLGACDLPYNPFMVCYSSMGGVSHSMLTLINIIIRIHWYLSQVMSLSPGSVSLQMVMLDINWTNHWCD